MGYLISRRYAPNVYDFFAPVRLPLETFNELISRTDEGVGNHTIALIISENVSFRALDIVRPESLGLHPSEYERVSKMVDDLDQMLFFAFEDAPDEIVTEWASERDKSLAEEAVRRVRHIRREMINLSRLWEEKSTSIISPMIGVDYDVLHDEKGAATSAIMYISAARIGGLGRPDLTDANRIRFQIWPADVEYLMNQLEHLRHAHFAKGNRGEVEDESEESSSGKATSEG